MEPSLTSAAALAQGLPLWAMPLALIQNRNPKRFPDGTASWAMPAAGCEPARSSFAVQRLPTRREPLPPIPNRSASRPAVASDVAGLVCGSLPAGVSPAVTPANPTTSAIPTTARAIAADCAIPAYPCRVRTSRRSRAPSLSESNAGIKLQGSLSRHTTAMDAANRAIGSSCGRNPGISTAAPKSQSIPLAGRGPDGYSSHALAPARVRHRAPIVHIGYRIEAAVLQSKVRPHFGHRAARRNSPGCVE
jgi:hypothetical protein